MDERQARLLVESVADYAICTPYWGAKDVEHDDCKRWLRAAVPRLKHYRVTSCAYIDMARAVLLRRVELGGHKGIVFIDHDILFQPLDVLRLIQAADDTGAVVAGAYCMRKSGDRLIGGFAEDVESVTFFEGGGLYAGAWCGMGFTAIPWTVIEAMVGHHKPPRVRAPLTASDADAVEPASDDPSLVWPLFALDTAGGWYNGEDVSFCQRLHAAGQRLYIDTRARLQHKGSYAYGIEDANVVVPRGASVQVTLQRSRVPLQAADAHKFEGLRAAE